MVPDSQSRSRNNGVRVRLTDGTIVLLPEVSPHVLHLFKKRPGIKVQYGGFIESSGEDARSREVTLDDIEQILD